MKLLIFIVIFSLCDSAFNQNGAWENFKELYKKIYSGHEEEILRQVMKFFSWLKIFLFLTFKVR